MKRGIAVTREYDWHDRPCVVIRKRRGKLTLAEVKEILHFEDNHRWNGYYILPLNCTESTLGGNGCFDLMDEPPGDAVTLYELEEGDTCPVCASALPPFRYCPNCGSTWSEVGQNIEMLLTEMQQEAKRGIENPHGTEASRLAWYWSHIGSLDLAGQLGLITEKRRLELYDQMKALKPDGAVCIVERGSPL